jgi:hypothetical protein
MHVVARPLAELRPRAGDRIERREVDCFRHAGEIEVAGMVSRPCSPPHDRPTRASIAPARSPSAVRPCTAAVSHTRHPATARGSERRAEFPSRTSARTPPHRPAAVTFPAAAHAVRSNQIPRAAGSAAPRHTHRGQRPRRDRQAARASRPAGARGARRAEPPGRPLTPVNGDLVIARTKDGTAWRRQHVDCTA